MAPHDDYEYHCPANLLVASNGPRKGVRVQASYIKKEFIDDDLIGRGPTGNLYFDDVQDFESIQNGVPVLHSYKITEVMQGGRYTVVVEFSNSVKGPSAPYAKFEGVDFARIIVQNGLNGYQYYGKWATFGLVGINATVSKRPGENTVLTFASTRVTLTNNRNSVVGGPFEISGEFFFRDQITLQGSPRVFYTNGAIIFYRPRGVNPDNTAYFIPSTEFLPGQAALFENAQWGNVQLTRS